MFTLVAVIVMFAITIEAASIEKREVDADDVEMDVDLVEKRGRGKKKNKGARIPGVVLKKRTSLADEKL